MSQSASWSDDRVAMLSKLWLEGLSAAQIAKRLGGITGNAVIGKIHRLGLSGRPACSRPARPASTTPARRSPAASRTSPRPPALTPPPQASTLAEGAGLVRDLTQLGAHACRWPIGDPKAADFSFCGRPADGRYCALHERRGVRTGAAWRADRDPVVRRDLAGLV